MGDAISECTHGPASPQATALRRHGQLSRLTCRLSDVLNHVQPLNILPFCIMLQPVSPESWIRVICTAQLTDFFVTASSQRST